MNIWDDISFENICLFLKFVKFFGLKPQTNHTNTVQNYRKDLFEITQPLLKNGNSFALSNQNYIRHKDGMF